MTRALCPACRGTGIQHIRAACHYVPCYVCQGRGAILLSLPPLMPGVPSSGGNQPQRGGENQIKKWLAPLVFLLLGLACTFDASQLRALPGAIGPASDAGADLQPAIDLQPTPADLQPVIDLRPVADLQSSPDQRQPADLRPVVDLLPDLLPPSFDALFRDDAGHPLCPNLPTGGYTLGITCPSVVACFQATVTATGAKVIGPCLRVVPSTGIPQWYVSDCSQCAGIVP